MHTVQAGPGVTSREKISVRGAVLLDIYPGYIGSNLLGSFSLTCGQVTMAQLDNRVADLLPGLS